MIKYQINVEENLFVENLSDLFQKHMAKNLNSLKKKEDYYPSPKEHVGLVEDEESKYSQET